MRSKSAGNFDKHSSKTPPWLAGRYIVTAALAIAPAVLVTGCSSPAADICDLFCECEGCTQSEYDECLGQGESAVVDADDLGCSAEYDDYLSCVVEEAECRDDEHFTFDGCIVEKKALAECGNVVLNPCEAAAQKLCDCQLGCDIPPAGEQCTGQDECQSSCIAAASCSDIINQPFGSDYYNCLVSC